MRESSSQVFPSTSRGHKRHKWRRRWESPEASHRSATELHLTGRWVASRSLRALCAALQDAAECGWGALPFRADRSTHRGRWCRGDSTSAAERATAHRTDRGGPGAPSAARAPAAGGPDFRGSNNRGGRHAPGSIWFDRSSWTDGGLDAAWLHLATSPQAIYSLMSFRPVAHSSRAHLSAALAHHFRLRPGHTLDIYI